MKKFEKLLRVMFNAFYRRALIKCGVAAGVEHEFVLKQFNCRTIVDIGANRGQFSLAAKYVFPKARIFSFEPLSGPAAIFRRAFSGDSRVELFETAIGPEKAEAEIHVSRRDDSSSLLPITRAQDALFPGTAEKGTTIIRVARLGEHVPFDSIDGPALLKLDVQGYELHALQGCDDLLYRFDWIYVECSFIELYAGQAMADEVVAWLRERDFALRGVFNMAYDRAGRAIQADFLFFRTS